MITIWSLTLNFYINLFVKKQNKNNNSQMTQPPHHLFHTSFINSVKQGWFGSIMMSQHISKNSNQMIKEKKKHIRVLSKCYPGKEPSVQNSNLLLKFCAFLALQLVFVVSGVIGHLKMAPDLLQREKKNKY